jgi:hypothetical protein
MGKVHSYNDLQGWADQYQKAVEEGIFDKPDLGPSVSKQNQKTDFFNMNIDIDHTDNNQDNDQDTETNALNEDAKCWSELFKLTNRWKRPSEGTIKQPSTKVIKENLSIDTKSYTKDMASSANPIRPSSLGKDNGDGNPAAFGTTYGVNELEKLEDLKVKLHNLIDKLNGFDVSGQNGNKLENQIQSMKKQIDEISDGLSKSFPSQQGD